MELAETVKVIIESRPCPVHDIYPLVEIVGTELNISCCCTEFHEQCNSEINALFMKNKDFPYRVVA